MTEISPDDQAARDRAAVMFRRAADALAEHDRELPKTLRLWADNIATHPWPGWSAVAHAFAGDGHPPVPTDDTLTALLDEWVPPATIGRVRRVVRRLIAEAAVPDRDSCGVCRIVPSRWANPSCPEHGVEAAARAAGAVVPPTG